jgi:RNA polymerase sigma-70 factor (ECF subfamily)
VVDRSATLIRLAQRGDRRALETLLERHLPAVRGYVRLNCGRLLRTKESSTDLVQSVCREILQHMGRFRHASEEGFRQWLYVTAMRKIRNRYQYYRAGKRDAALEIALESPESSGDSGAEGGLLGAYASFCTPSSEAVAREEIERIEKAFDELSDDEREVILLARVVCLTRAAIAKRLDLSEGAVRTRLSRALARLAERLDDG